MQSIHSSCSSEASFPGSHAKRSHEFDNHCKYGNSSTCRLLFVSSHNVDLSSTTQSCTIVYQNEIGINENRASSSSATGFKIDEEVGEEGG